MKKLEISKNDIIYNLEQIRKHINDVNKNVKIIAVVKANGMGLGLIEYSKFLIQNGIEILAVANVEEAIALREAGIDSEILMMSPVSLKKELQLLVINDITITIGSLNELELAEETSKDLNKKVKAHIKVDTGFGRYGFLYTEKETILETIKKANNINICGMFTHFSNAISEKNTVLQFNRFKDVIEFLKENNCNIPMLHASASTAFLKYPNMMLDAVRLRFSYTRKNFSK